MEAIRGRALPAAPGAALGASLVGALAVFVAWPLLGLLAPARNGFAGVIAIGFATSAGVAIASTIVTVALGAALAYLTARTPGLATRALVVALAMSLVLPSFTAALALRVGLDAAGASPRSAIGAMMAVAVAQVVTLLPHAFAIVSNTMRRIDVGLEDAAVSLGAAPATALARVTLVLARPGLWCAFLAVLALALADVASPLAIGGAAPFLSAHVVAAARGGDVAHAAAGALVLTAPCVLVWLAALRAGWMRLGPLPLAPVTPGAVPARVAPAIAAAVTAVLVGVYALVPAGALRVAEPASLAAGVGATLRVAAATAIVGTVVAFAFAVVAVRLPLRAARRLGSSALAAAGIPGIALGLGYVVVLDVVPPAPLWIAIAALSAWKLPAAVALLTRRLRAHDPALEEVAVSLGAANVTVMRRIVGPLLAPALVATFLDLFVQALTSASLLVLLAPSVSASASALTRVAAGDVAGAAVLVTGLAVVTVVAVLARAWLSPREPLALLPA